MATTTLQVTSGDDDAYENANGTVFDRTGVIVACDAGTTAATRIFGAFRFQDVQIPQGAVINSAILRVVPTTTTYDDPKLLLACEDVDNAVSFATNADVATRVASTSTTATVDWTTTNVGALAYVDSPDIKTCIQEVINRSGWEPGNALVVFAAGKSGTAGGFRVKSYNADPALAAVLEINWTKTAKVIVQTRRVDAGPVNVDSAGVTVYSAEIALVGPSFPTTPAPGSGAIPAP